jgi:hypothetical protein
MAGKRVKCPHCSKPFQVPGVKGRAAASTRRPAPVARPAASTNPFDSIEDAPASDDAPRRRRRSRGSPFKLMLIVLFLFGCLAGGAYAAWHYKLINIDKVLVQLGIKPKGEETTKEEDTAKAQTSKPDTGKKEEETKKDPPAAPPPATDPHFLPDNTAVVVNLNLEALTASKPFERLLEEAQAKKFKPEEIDKFVIPVLGLQYSSIARIVVGASGKEDAVIVVRPRNPITVDQVLPNKKKGGADYKEVKVGRFTMYEGAMDAFCLAEDKLLLLSPKPALLKAVLERDKPPEFKPDLQAALKLTDPAKAFSVAVDAKSGQKELTSAADVKLEGDLAPLAKINAVAVQLDTSAGLELTTALVCADAGTATAIKKLADDGMTMVKEMLQTIQKDNEDKPEAVVAKKAEELLGQLKVAVNGADITATLAVNLEMTLELIKLAKDFIPGKEKE